MKKLVPLNGLRAFEVAVRAGSLTAAARELHVTPSAISHQLKRLEEQLGMQLMERTPQRLALTPAGQDYYRAVSAAFEQLVAATGRLLRERDQQVVTLTAPPVFSVKWLVRRLADFHRRHPDIEVRVSTSYRTMDLRHGDYDLGIRWGTGDWPGLQVERLMGDTVQPVCSPKLIAPGKTLTLKALLRQPLIHMSFVRGDWRLWARLMGLDLPSSVRGPRFSEATAAIQAAVDGLGLVLGPRVLVHDEMCSGQLVTPGGEPVRLGDAYYLAYADRARRNPAAMAFRQWLHSICAAFERSQPAARLSLQPGETVSTTTLE